MRLENVSRPGEVSFRKIFFTYLAQLMIGLTKPQNFDDKCKFIKNINKKSSFFLLHLWVRSFFVLEIENLDPVFIRV